MSKCEYRGFGETYIEIPRVIIENPAFPISVDEIAVDALNNGDVAFVDTVSKAVKVSAAVMHCKPVWDEAERMTVWHHQDDLIDISYRVGERAGGIVERFIIRALPEDRVSGKDDSELRTVFELETRDGDILSGTLAALRPERRWTYIISLTSGAESEFTLLSDIVEERLDDTDFVFIGGQAGDEGRDAADTAALEDAFDSALSALADIREGLRAIIASKNGSDELP